MQIYLNGEFVPKERASVSVFDHGLLYGDGVFEGIRAYNGRVFRLAEHVRRLYDSAHAIRLTIPMSMDEMEEVVRASFRKNDIRDGYARLVVTRGVGDLGLNPDKCPVPTTFCIADTIALYPARYYEEGLAVVTAATRRNTPCSMEPRRVAASRASTSTRMSNVWTATTPTRTPSRLRCARTATTKNDTPTCVGRGRTTRDASSAKLPARGPAAARHVALFETSSDTSA